MASMPVGPGTGSDEWTVTLNGHHAFGAETQYMAIHLAAQRCRARWAQGQTAELNIKGRNGRIRDARTYGRDPRGTKG